MGKNDYHFLLPQVKKKVLGTQGELATYIPYRLEPGVSCDSIKRELRRQPHMAALADYLDEERRLYFLESESEEVLQLAAEYIGTFHRLACFGSEGYREEEEEVDDDWEEGEADSRSFDFAADLPYLNEMDLGEVYSSDDDFGFGGRRYRGEQQQRRSPWWLMNQEAPVCVFSRGSIGQIPDQIRAMEDRELIILLNQSVKSVQQELFGEEWHPFSLEDVSFELETEMLSLKAAEPDSPYKRSVLRQLARMRGAPLTRSSDAGRILALILDRRRDADNATIAKAVSNALVRRKAEGNLTARDFAYLEREFATGQKVSAREKEQKMVGQEDVRRQLERIVDSMEFQKRRAALGLPTETMHYTFAFLGAPGTGKTTWAMRLAKEMEKRKLLDNTEMICVNGAELKAKYVGHTTGKVKALFEQYGVIVLDEAYSLCEGELGDSYGNEALAQLCVELERHGTDRLVIFAGYGGADNSEDNRMLRFLQSNPGINSRIAFKVHFSNFSAPALTEVFASMMEGYQLPGDYRGAVEAFFRRRMKARAFGNCREARNLAERVRLQMAVRLAKVEELTKTMAQTVILEDLHTAISETMEEYRGLEKDGRQ